MRYLLFILLSLSLTGYSQIPVFRLTFDPPMTDHSGNNFACHHNGTTVVSSTRVEGSYSWMPNYDYVLGNWESDGVYDLGDRIYTLTGNIYVTSASGESMIFTNKQNNGSYGIDLRWDNTNMRLRGRSSNGSAYDFATASSILSYDTWYHFVFIADGGYVRIYLNDTKLVMADSSICNDYTASDTLAMGTTTDNQGNPFWGNARFDNFQFYDYELTPAQVDSLYDNRTSSTFQLGEAGGAPPDYNPINGLHLRIWKDGIEKIPYKGGQMVYFNKKEFGIEPPTDTIVYVWNETFENDRNVPSLSSMSIDSIEKYWQPVSHGWYEPGQTRYYWGANHGYVWKSTYPSGHYGVGYGFGIMPQLDQPYTELWLSYDLFVGVFDWHNETYNTNAGKMPFGMVGGHFTIEWTDSTRGWWLHGLWGGNAQFKNYFYHHDQVHHSYAGADQGYWANSEGMPIGYWENITMRTKLNSAGHPDGIAEYYVDGLLVSQHDTLRLQSLTQYLNKDNQITGLMYGLWFGGGSESASDNASTIYVDNLCAYYYTPSAVNYLAGAASPGHTIPIVYSSDIKYQNQVMADKIYTASADTITIVDNYAGCLPSENLTITKTITGHSSPIHYEFLDFMDGSNDTDDSYWNVYSGTGPGKTFMYKFDGGEDGGTTPSGEYTISNTSATFEFHNGTDGVYNMHIKYH